MKVNVVYENQSYLLHCGSGQQRVAWVARVAAQRLGSGGAWCPKDKEVGRPREYVPGRVFFLDGDEMDTESTLAALAEGNAKDDSDFTLVVELREKPSHGLPSLAAKGSEDSVVPPKNSKAAISYQVTKGIRGSIVKRTPAPMPEPHEGYDFEEVYARINIFDITEREGKADRMIMDAVKNVLMNNFVELVDIFLHYARPRVTGGMEAEGQDLTVSMKSLAVFVRTCRLASEECSFFEIQNKCVREELWLSKANEDEFSLAIYDAQFALHEFLEALIRISALKHFGLEAVCDQINTLIHTKILPYATGDDENRIREFMHDPKCVATFTPHRSLLKKYYTKRMKRGAKAERTVTLKEFIKSLQISEQLDEELNPAAVKEAWLATLAFDVRPDLYTEDDTTLEISLSEFEEMIVRCVLSRSKIKAEENLWSQTELFLKRFNRSN